MCVVCVVCGGREGAVRRTRGLAAIVLLGASLTYCSVFVVDWKRSRSIQKAAAGVGLGNTSNLGPCTRGSEMHSTSLRTYTAQHLSIVCQVDPGICQEQHHMSGPLSPTNDLPGEGRPSDIAPHQRGLKMAQGTSLHAMTWTRPSNPPSGMSRL